MSRAMARLAPAWLLLCSLCAARGYNVVRRDPYAHLSESVVTRQRAACDGDILQLECPARTKADMRRGWMMFRMKYSTQRRPPVQKNL